METLDTMFAIIISINVMLFLGQAAILNLNPEGEIFYNCNGTILGQAEASGCTSTAYVLKDASNPASLLPGGNTGVSQDTGNIFTDTFNSLKEWLLDTTGLGYVIQILSAPSNFVKSLGAPPEFAFAVGGLWYLMSIIVVVAWLVGRN